MAAVLKWTLGLENIAVLLILFSRIENGVTTGVVLSLKEIFDTVPSEDRLMLSVMEVPSVLLVLVDELADGGVVTKSVLMAVVEGNVVLKDWFEIYGEEFKF